MAKEVKSFKDFLSELLLVTKSFEELTQSDKKAILDIKTHALAYLKYIPQSKQLKTEIALCKTEDEFYNCVNKIYNHINVINK